MYTREIQAPRPTPVENGMPLQGTWTRAFEEVDLLDIHRPYPVPMPRGIRDFRIKEWETFIIQDDRFFLQARLCNLKFFRDAHVFMYDRETNERIEFRKLIPGGGWRLPRGLHNASVDSRSYGFFFRIHSWLDTESIVLELNIKRTRRRPALTAHAKFDLSLGAAGKALPMAVNLLFSERRSMYAYKVMTAVSGDLISGGKHFHLHPAKTSGLFSDFKGFYPYRMRSTWCAGLGFDEKNRRFGFALGENQAKEAFKNNENALWIDGKLTLLPPVKITRGPEEDWIIQDMEGMVDLVFTPGEPSRNIENFLFFSSDNERAPGYFNGHFLSSEGEELTMRNVWGTCEKLYLRV
ncbi:MAG: DUF2804 domain-containing protein [Treponema sp.]|nr:DUF2804 domain-containing protein [Treponema sp.]